MTSLLAVFLLAATPADDAAKEKFSRAVRLFDADSYAQALAVFEELYAETHAPGVLFNVAVSYAQLGQPIEAVEKFDALLAAPGGFPKDRLDRAKQLRDAQAAKIASLKIDAALEQALVEIDGRSRPLVANAPIPVNPGHRFVTVLAPGHLPWREEVAIAPGAEQSVTPKLIRSEVKPAQVRIDCSIADVDVFIDGRLAARTPVPVAIALAPGQHEVSLRREGYRSISAPLTLAEGANETLRFDPQVDPAASSRGTLTLNISEPQAVVSIDGAPVGIADRIDVPPGRHALTVRRDGFFPVDREVVVPKNGALQVQLRLEPTPELRGALSRSASAHRLWGITTLAVGAAIAVTGAATIGLNRGPYEKANAEFDAAQREFEATKTAAAAERYNRAGPLLTEKENIQFVGAVTLGVGAVAAGAGLFILFTGPDLGRYDAPAGGDTLAPLFAVGLGPGGLHVSGRF